MKQGDPIRVSKSANGYKVYQDGEPEMFYPTKKALLSAVDKHFESKRDKPLDMVQVAHEVCGIGEGK